MNSALLHLHSSSSALWGIYSPLEAVCRAKALGYRRIALTDRNGLYGLFFFLEAAAEEGITPIIGAEVERGDERALLWVKNGEGYRSLCRILSERHCNPAFTVSGAVAAHRKGLIVASDRESVLAPLAAQKREDLYVELSPGHGIHEGLKICRSRRIPPVATTRAVGFSQSDLSLHRVLRAVALSKTLSRLNEEDTARQWDIVLAPQMLADHFPHCPDAVDNIEVIANQCVFTGPDTSTVMPVYHGLSKEGANELLRRKAYDGAARRYGTITPAVEERLEKELSQIALKGFASYFLVVEEIVTKSPRTCGRGSAAASLVAYSLGITHVDPLKYNLFFERFLNPGRVDPPDIDVDFPWDERDGLLDAVFALYGAKRVAMVANQVGFKPRAALREVAKVYGMPEAEISRVQKLARGKRKFGFDYDPADPASRPPWPEIFETASRLSGHLRHLSVHCGGVVIAPEDMRDHAVVEVAAKGVPVIQWEKDQCEASGLVKIDLLGNRSLAVIRDVLAELVRTGRPPIDYSTWKPAEDPATLQTVRRGETMGCFYVESPATRLLLKKMWSSPKSRSKDVYDHLVMASSIIRPAANRFIKLFVARMHGEKWNPLHPLLDGVLNETYGVAIYQEQVTQIAMALAGFSAVEGDKLRKVLAQKDPTRKLADLAGKFMEGATRKGVPVEVVDEAWSQILSFSVYSFCKPHSASYALVSMKCAYLKTHYPAEFLAAVLANHGGFYSPFAYLSEARRMGLTVHSPSVNQSMAAWSGGCSQIRVGLGEIKGLSGHCVASVIKARASGGAFANLDDFLRRVDPSHDDASQLARSGALDELHPEANRAALLWEVDSAFGEGVVKRGNNLFDEEKKPEEPTFKPKPHTLGMLRQMEWESLGFPVSYHPLSPFTATINRLKAAKGPPLIPGRELARYGGRRVRLVGWRITAKPALTKDGDPMEFVSFEDTTAIYETVLFPQVYRQVWAKLAGVRPFLIEGRVEMEFNVPTVTVEKVERI